MDNALKLQCNEIRGWGVGEGRGHWLNDGILLWDQGTWRCSKHKLLKWQSTDSTEN